MIDLRSFENLQLRGGFRIARLELAGEPLVDALGREAIARTSVIGREFHIVIRSGLSDEELSITLYHEILEAMTVGSDNPPDAVVMFNEGDFERAAHRAHHELGEASPATIDRMLQSHDFRWKWGMLDAANVQIDLIKLADGARLLRFTDRVSGLSVERKVDSARSVNEQKKQLADVFQAAVARAQLTFTWSAGIAPDGSKRL